jgi:hypothetical protein
MTELDIEIVKIVARFGYQHAVGWVMQECDVSFGTACAGVNDAMDNSRNRVQ